MTDNKRLLELALKGLETERQRIDEEVREIHRQLGGRSGTASAATAQSQRLTQSQSRSNLTPAGRRKLADLMRRRWAEKRKAGTVGSSSDQKQAAKKSAGGNLTAAGRKKLSDLMKRRWAERRKAAAKGSR